jgi:transglutaminase-like putative cysteine protease
MMDDPGMALIELTHTTQYRYDRAVRLSPQTLRLHPVPALAHGLHSYRLEVQPYSTQITWMDDALGNRVAMALLGEPTDLFEAKVHLTASAVDNQPWDISGLVHRPYSAQEKTQLALYLQTEESPELLDFVHELSWPEQGFFSASALQTACAQIKTRIAYKLRPEPGFQAPLQTLQLLSGACRDTAWLLAQSLRLRGVATRFVSGYLLSANASPTAPTNELHAWCEVFVPQWGWLGLDTTSGQITGSAHLALACAHHPDFAAPIDGAHEKAEVTFSHNITVTAL